MVRVIAQKLVKTLKEENGIILITMIMVRVIVVVAVIIIIRIQSIIILSTVIIMGIRAILWEVHKTILESFLKLGYLPCC